MATFYDSLPLNVIKQLIKAELMEAYRTTEVEIHGIEFDDDIYGYDEDPKSQELLQRLKVTATVSGNDTHQWLMLWSADMGKFESLSRNNQDLD